MRFKKEKLFKAGQAALMVVLVMAVALGFGISIISQSTTDIRMTEQEQEAARAFNAAEAGIEAALKSISVRADSITVDGIQVDYNIKSRNDFEGIYKEGETAQVLIGGNWTLNIEWIKQPAERPGTCIGESNLAPASLLITVHKNDNTIRRVGINACNLHNDNGMTNVTDLGNDDYYRLYQLPVAADEDMLRIIPIYNTASIRVTRASGAALPAQLYQINSTAQTATKETKAIEVTRTEPATPSVFDYVLFSGSNLVK